LKAINSTETARESNSRSKDTKPRKRGCIQPDDCASDKRAHNGFQLRKTPLIHAKNNHMNYFESVYKAWIPKRLSSALQAARGF
jgi:hypothetical protein